MPENDNPTQNAATNVLQPSVTPTKIQLKQPVKTEPLPPPPPSAPINMVQPVHTPSPIAQRMRAVSQVQVTPVETFPQFKTCPYCRSNVPLANTSCFCGWNFFMNMPAENQINNIYNLFHKTLLVIMGSVGIALLCSLLSFAVRAFSTAAGMMSIITLIASLVAFVFSRIMIYKYYAIANTYANGLGIKLPVDIPPMLGTLLPVLVGILEIPCMIVLEINCAKCLAREKNFSPIIFFAITAFVGPIAIWILSIVVIAICHSLHCEGFGVFLTSISWIIYFVVLFMSLTAVYSHLNNEATDILREYNKLVNKERRMHGIAGE